jgi:NAD(P)-dependent dehydrogenase (short-subunit alcohol dehydrogenase family)
VAGFVRTRYDAWMEELAGRIAVVTGAASGMGLRFAERFAAEGMRVVLADVEEDALKAAEEGLSASGADVLAIRTDVSRWEDVEALAQATFDHFGTAHVVCNNAGVVTAGPVEELTLDDWEWVLGVNLWGVIHGVKAFLPRMIEQGEGHMVATASTAGLVASPSIGPYNVSKFGVVALMETVVRDLQARKSPVGASVLCPGEVATRIGEAERNRPAGSQHEASDAEAAFLDAVGKMVPKGLDPAEVAGLVVEAIRHDRFWIITHPEWKKILERRVKLLVEDDALPPRYP